jgi:hypothetical protein
VKSRGAEDAVKSRARNAEASSDVAEGEAFGAELARAPTIDDGGRSADALAETSCALDAGPRAGGDLAALLLGDPGEDRDEEVSDGASGVEPGLADADDLDAEVVEGEDVLDVADHGASESVEGEDDDGLEVAEVGAALEPLPGGAVSSDGADGLLEHVRDGEAAGARELLDGGALRVGVLLVGGAAEVEGAA